MTCETEPLKKIIKKLFVRSLQEKILRFRKMLTGLNLNQAILREDGALLNAKSDHIFSWQGDQIELMPFALCLAYRDKSLDYPQHILPIGHHLKYMLYKFKHILEIYYPITLLPLNYSLHMDAATECPAPECPCE